MYTEEQVAAMVEDVKRDAVEAAKQKVCMQLVFQGSCTCTVDPALTYLATSGSLNPWIEYILSLIA